MTARRWALYRKLWKGRVVPYAEAPFELSLSKEVLTDRFGQMRDDPAPKKQTRQK